MTLNLITSRASLGRTDYYAPINNASPSPPPCDEPVITTSISGLIGTAQTNDLSLNNGGGFVYAVTDGSNRFAAGIDVLQAINSTDGVQILHTITGTSVKGVGTRIDVPSASDGFDATLACYDALGFFLGSVTLNFVGGIVAGTAPYIGVLSDQFDIARVVLETDPVGTQVFFDDYDLVRSAQAIGDPHFVGFNGEKYDVMGYPGKCFNILSDSNIQCNALFEQCKNMYVGYTHLAEIGIQIGNNETGIKKITYSATEKPTFEENEIKENTHIIFESGITNTKAYIKYNKNKLIVDSGNYFIEFTKEIEWHEPVIAMRTNINKNIGVINPHGILGQTANFTTKKKAKKRSKQGEGILENTFIDYYTKSLFDNNFLFNRFNPVNSKIFRKILV